MSRYLPDREGKATEKSALAKGRPGLWKLLPTLKKFLPLPPPPNLTRIVKLSFHRFSLTLNPRLLIENEWGLEEAELL